MAYINENFLKLSAGYLFPEISRRVAAFAQEHPDRADRIIRCGIGDVTEPLPAAVISALHQAVDELAQRDTFKGYGPATGYDFVREAIAANDFAARGANIGADEIFLSDGSKPDCSALLEVLGAGNVVAVCDPVYPVYVDTNVMSGNTGNALTEGGYAGLEYLPGTPENNFIPDLPRRKVDVIYLCFPNNPTGAMITREQLATWVDYARTNDALILYDAAYEAYIRDPALPRSIFEIPGATECAIELRSFSKNGGFTGLRAGYTVVPKALHARTRSGARAQLHPLWMRRWSTCSNGVSWPVQRAVAALYTPEGKKQVAALVDFYMENARLLRAAAAAQGLRVWGGQHAPYVWVECPRGQESWSVFDFLLREAQLVVTPGAGFGRHGARFFRISAFNSRLNAQEAGRRLAVLSQAATAA